MELHVVKSTNLAAIGYDPESQTLFIRFHYADRVYGYQDVPHEMYRRLMDAESKGAFFRENVKDRFTYSVVTQ